MLHYVCQELFFPDTTQKLQEMLSTNPITPITFIHQWNDLNNQRDQWALTKRSGIFSFFLPGGFWSVAFWGFCLFGRLVGLTLFFYFFGLFTIHSTDIEAQRLACSVLSFERLPHRFYWRIRSRLVVATCGGFSLSLKEMQVKDLVGKKWCMRAKTMILCNDAFKPW